MVWNDLDTDLVRRTIAAQKLTEQLQIGIIFAAYAVVFLYFFRPLLNQKNPFLLETWTTNNIILDGIVLAGHYYFFCIVTPVILSYDTVYLSLCVHVVLQLRIFKRKMETFSGTYNCEKGIGNRSIALDIIIKFVSICVLFAQFAFYTFPAERVAFELSDLSNSIYMSEWYRNTIAVQKQLLFMMLKCNQQSYFTGGGFINVNIDTFGSVRKYLIRSSADYVL
ncbi:hypothetical protein Trydic_g21049 [Trypoxylus dichotomus]